MPEHITLRGARENNLQAIDLDIPRNRLVVVTGLSGSGKSSLAFDTIFAEGQRRYMESLSAYARQFLEMMERPEIDYVDGLSPVISIEQKTVSGNPRSTVGTVTEVYDFLRLLYARAATAYSHETGNRMRQQSDDEIVDGILDFPEGTRLQILAPVVLGRKGHYRELFEQTSAQGFERFRVDGEMRTYEEDMKLERYATHDVEVVIDRLAIKDGIRSRVSQSVETALEMGGGTLIADVVDGLDGVETGDHLFSRDLVDPETGLSYEEPSPNMFSFNTPYGACPECEGLGTAKQIAPELVVPHPEKTVNEGALAPLGEPRDIWIFNQLEAVAEAYDFDFDTPIEVLSDEQLAVILEGAGEEQFEIEYGYKGREVQYKHRFDGLYDHIWHTYEETSSSKKRRRAESFMREMDCPACGGGRLKTESLHYRIGGKSIADLAQMDLTRLRDFVEDVPFDTERQTRIGEPIVKEVRERLDFLIGVGVGYLTLDRPARTLSGGESQRIRLATQVGTQLTGVLYVLDEPTIGLHPRDNDRLIESLESLRDLGNSVVVVEHDRDMIEAADHVVDLGPGAGIHGGHVITTGPPSVLTVDPVEQTNGTAANGAAEHEIEDNGVARQQVAERAADYDSDHYDFESFTAAYLQGERVIPLPDERRDGTGESITLKGATGHNLKREDVDVPLGTLICVTGVSGSGKSTLVNQTLFPILHRHHHNAKTVPLPYDRVEGIDHVDKVIEIDQQPIGRTPRSNAATYTKLMDYLRDLFAQLPEAEIRGYTKSRFSFNTDPGRCDKCGGTGTVTLEMNFLPDVDVTCDACDGKRYGPETLEVEYKGKNIAEVLDMTVAEAVDFFENQPRLVRTLKTLDAVGLGYLTLGQSSTTLSGGEAQRVKLSKELSRPGTGDTLYILDEPTTGMHFEDVRHLLNVLHGLVDEGNTVMVIEHNMDVIKQADHVIDLGPEGGREGGEILFEGRPEALAEADTHTSAYLREELERTRTAQTDAEKTAPVGESGDGLSSGQPEPTAE
ncbi:excinuclease ABC subunit A [Salinibacter ruber]|uniref:excinuclease ABC subunit UvrA n=1 Tax=Salinibacter ruber TaxID=146919 RepID=UPI00216A4616|nr:ATP-binding cassette domain-containing protein [Salinibacter ruber]MCS3699097.1 excinuclease ABC subunit A [Salinibacter ruber]